LQSKGEKVKNRGIECDERGKIGNVKSLGVEREKKKGKSNMGLVFFLSNGVEWFSNMLGYSGSSAL